MTRRLWSTATDQPARDLVTFLGGGALLVHGLIPRGLADGRPAAHHHPSAYASRRH
jgi:hypothetical protein